METLELEPSPALVDRAGRTVRWMGILAGACVLAWLVQAVPRVTAPPTGAHAWRETDGLIVARNYCIEHAPFLEPRVNNRGDTDGRTGLEFPVLNFISGRIGCVTGDFVTPWRVISLLSALVVAMALWDFGRRAFGPNAGMAAVIGFATSPLVPYFSRTTQPDMVAAALASGAMALSLRSKKTGGVALAGAFVLGMGAALVKLPAAVYLLPVVLFSLPEQRSWVRPLLARLAMGAAAAGGALAWYRYARALELLNGLRNFGVTRSPLELWAEWHLPAFWLKQFVQHPFDVWVFPLATVILLGVLAWKRFHTPWPIGVLAATALAYIFLCGYSGAHHDYYGVVLLPALALMIGWASAEVLPADRPTALAVITVLIAAAVVYQVLRARTFWPQHRDDWEQVESFALREIGPQGRERVAVFSDGSPQMFWFTHQLGRFADVGDPKVDERERFAVVDRLRLRADSGTVESKLQSAGCTPVFSNAVAWICRNSQAR